jgi:hypothetical protein
MYITGFRVVTVLTSAVDALSMKVECLECKFLSLV